MLSHCLLAAAAATAGIQTPPSPESAALQRRWESSKNEIVAACNNTCRSRIVGSFNCSDTEWLVCIARTGSQAAVSAHIRRPLTPTDRCYEQGAYRFEEISELFPAERCTEAVQRDIDARDSEEREEQRRRLAVEQGDKARAAAARANHERLVADLRSGKRQPQSFEERRRRDGVGDALALVVSPKLQADGALYGLLGLVVAARGPGEFEAQVDVPPPAVLALRAAGVGLHNRIVLRSSGEVRAAVAAHARVGSVFSAYGRYVGNDRRTLADGRSVLVPILELTTYSGL